MSARGPLWCGLGCALLVAVPACSDGGGLDPDGALTDGQVEAAPALDGAVASDTLAAQCDPATLVAAVDPQRMLADLQQLVGLGERTSQSGQSQAAAYLRGELSQLGGVTLREQTYQLGGEDYVNLEATIAGSDPSAEVVAMGAHYDSTSEQPGVAPGADDNASGTVAVLEAARVLSGCRPQRSVRLLFFSNEEQGIVGSQVYVKQLTSELTPAALVGFLSVDMVGYGPSGEDLDLATRPEHASLVHAVAASVEQHTSLSVKKIISEHCG